MLSKRTVQACFTFIHMLTQLKGRPVFTEICVLEALTVVCVLPSSLVFLSLFMVVSLSTCSPQRRVLFASVMKAGTPTKAAICTGFSHHTKVLFECAPGSEQSKLHCHTFSLYPLAVFLWGNSVLPFQHSCMSDVLFLIIILDSYPFLIVVQFQCSMALWAFRC